jgi:hypothetical protein
VLLPHAKAQGWSANRGYAPHLALPAALTVSASAHDATGERSFTYTLPAPGLRAYCGANAAWALPAPRLSARGTVAGMGHAALSAPSALLRANGTLSGMASAFLTFGADTDTYRLVGYGGAIGAVTLFGRPTVQAQGTTGAVGQGAVTLPLFELVASGSRQNVANADLLLPAPVLAHGAVAWLMAPHAHLFAIGTASVALSYEAYAVNLKHTPRPGVEAIDEVTRYTHYPFERIVRHQNSYYGMAADGLYLLEGTTDDGTPISYAVRTAITDFNKPEKKTLVSARFGGRLGPGTTVTLYAGENGEFAYPYTTPRGQLAQNHREKFGRGIKNRYFALGLNGDSTLGLDSLEFEINDLMRRI